MTASVLPFPLCESQFADLDAALRQTQHYSPHQGCGPADSSSDKTLCCLRGRGSAWPPVRTLYILAGGFVSKCFVQGQPLELADLLLIRGADAQVADLLDFGRLARSSGPRCPNRLYDLCNYLYDNSERDPIRTLFRRVSDVGLGYTPPRHQFAAANSDSGTYV